MEPSLHDHDYDEAVAREAFDESIEVEAEQDAKDAMLRPLALEAAIARSSSYELYGICLHLATLIGEHRKGTLQPGHVRLLEEALLPGMLKEMEAQK